MRPILSALCLLCLTSASAFAHPGHAEAAGWSAGFAHPLGGFDHVVAMSLVGMIAALRGGRALWAVPVSFLALMVAGAVLGFADVTLPLVEAGILASLAVFGLLLLLGRNLPIWMLSAFAGAFAIFHGYAHGVEMPETASGLRYGLGFLAGTALLILAGLGFGRILVLAARHRAGKAGAVSSA